MLPEYSVAKQAVAGVQIFAVGLEYPVALLLILGRKKDRRLSQMQCNGERYKTLPMEMNPKSSPMSLLYKCCLAIDLGEEER